MPRSADNSLGDSHWPRLLPGYWRGQHRLQGWPGLHWRPPKSMPVKFTITPCTGYTCTSLDWAGNGCYCVFVLEGHEPRQCAVPDSDWQASCCTWRVLRRLWNVAV